MSESGEPDYKREVPVVTIALLIINVCVFILCTLTGSLLYNKLCVGLSLIDGPKSLYRIITSMFLHMDIEHIFSNMVILLFLGGLVEKEMGAIRYIALYMLSGISGVLFTFISEYITGEYVYIAGASGGVFGLLGAWFAFALFKRPVTRLIKAGAVAVVLIFMIVQGFRDTSIASYAHLGGLFAGFIGGVIYCLICIKKDRNRGIYED